MASDAIEVLAGDCTVTYDGDEHREERGAVVVLAKPDNTVLVHDRDGYGPVAWLTRADSISWTATGTGPTVEASKNGQRLAVTCHEEYGSGRYTASRAGQFAGPCPDCDGSLVHADGHVGCLECGAEYGIPRDATIVGDACDCGLPVMRVDRGAAFTVCVDRSCQSLDDAVRDRFDRQWSCPACDGDLLILRRRGLLAGCENYPECDTGFTIPTGTVTEACPECGLPVFATRSGERCLDASCAGPG